MMEKHNLVILSTAHLHPLEAAIVNKFAYVGNSECALFCTDPEMNDFYYQGGLVCLCDLLKLIKEKYDVKYVLFDPDVNATNEFKHYVW